MEKLKINLENCYGIRKLKKEFEFSKAHKTFSIYASNGSMKTSFAKTFENISKKENPEDLVFPERITSYSIKLDGQNIEPHQIFVIHSYKKEYESEKISTLLANKELRKQYENVYKQINDKKDSLLKELKKVCGLSKIDEIEKQISKVFYNNTENNFFGALERIKREINSDEVSKYENIKYKNIFDEKIINFLNDTSVQSDIKTYMEQYDTLLEDSTYFKKGIFNHSQAEDIAKQLKKNGFFKAEHAVLFGDKKLSTESELTKVIEREKEKILTDKKLQKSFQNLDTKMTKNASLKDFRDFLSSNNFIIAELQNLDRFKAKLWQYYIKENQEGFNNLLKIYEKGKKDIANISEEAKQEETRWLETIVIFNERFKVPFKITISNKVDVILKGNTPSIAFKFVENDDRKNKNIERENLLEVLSQGEKRALYLLDIIFEIEARKTIDGEHLFIIDDIADSFDYKNKYAIIEYLRDISKEENFYQIVLSHNYDFHRTISSRLSMERSNKLTVKKTNKKINLEKETYQNNIFKNWRENLDDKYKLIASITLVRNLAEYAGNICSENILTKFLHIKENYTELTTDMLKEEFGKVLSTGIEKIPSAEKYLDFLGGAIDDIDENNIELEHKITLAISIRLHAEIFMIYEIKDKDFVNGIEKHQTAKLLDKYKEKFKNEEENIKILNKMQLMTPESIHLNSFMFEPLLDMSHEYLFKLHKDIKHLKRQISVQS